MIIFHHAHDEGRAHNENANGGQDGTSRGDQELAQPADQVDINNIGGGGGVWMDTNKSKSKSKSRSQAERKAASTREVDNTQFVLRSTQKRGQDMLLRSAQAQCTGTVHRRSTQSPHHTTPTTDPPGQHREMVSSTGLMSA